MKTKLIATLIILISLVSCDKDNDNTTTKKVYDFSDITMYDEIGEQLNTGYPEQWRYDSDFTNEEKALFDSIDFSNIDLAKWVTPTFKTNLGFIPNPVRNVGSFFLYRNCDIFNFVMVDTLFNKVESLKINNTRHFSLTFTEFEPAYYRVYYVCQDSSRLITGMGYGNIQLIK